LVKDKVLTHNLQTHKVKDEEDDDRTIEAYIGAELYS